MLFATCLVGAENGHSSHVFNGRQAGHDCTVVGHLLRAQGQSGGCYDFNGQRNRGYQEHHRERES